MVSTLLLCWVYCTSSPPPDRTQPPYFAIAVSELADTHTDTHVNANNEDFSDQTAFGRFSGPNSGGSLVHLFPHPVTHIKGRRMSVSFCTPRLVHKLGNQVWTGLLEQGFPVQSCKQEVCVPCVQDTAASSDWRIAWTGNCCNSRCQGSCSKTLQ
eukprot:1077844-Amphidinium_carterae.1